MPPSSYLVLFLLAFGVSFLQASPPANRANTLPNIMARLVSQGEQVSIAAQVTDPAGMGWILLTREKNSEITYSLVRSIAGGADGVADSPSLPMRLSGLVHDDVVEPMLTGFVRQLLEQNKDHEGAQKFINDRPENFSGAPSQTRQIFSRYGLQLP